MSKSGTADGWRERYEAKDAEHVADMARLAKAHAEVVESLAAERDEAIARAEGWKVIALRQKNEVQP